MAASIQDICERMEQRLVDSLGKEIEELFYNWGKRLEKKMDEIFCNSEEMQGLLEERVADLALDERLIEIGEQEALETSACEKGLTLEVKAVDSDFCIVERNRGRKRAEASLSNLRTDLDWRSRRMHGTDFWFLKQNWLVELTRSGILQTRRVAILILLVIKKKKEREFAKKGMG